MLEFTCRWNKAQQNSDIRPMCNCFTVYYNILHFCLLYVFSALVHLHLLYCQIRKKQHTGKFPGWKTIVGLPIFPRWLQLNKLFFTLFLTNTTCSAGAEVLLHFLLRKDFLEECTRDTCR